MLPVCVDEDVTCLFSVSNAFIAHPLLKAEVVSPQEHTPENSLYSQGKYNYVYLF